eukprot:TRINITY_DN3082_c1_g1_i7.p2 TRINITY_DN3082_c1_g1~~TRINITY_DN3082_c1_g1_i7.p2  ORF type:complete len:138 (+),score=8.89 TRINITY_DN3082_c1_g1_i7:749-1162(+)
MTSVHTTVSVTACIADEPTSGLDSVTALMLCNILREISETCTVVCTIHQPQSKIYSLFDNLILLKAGDIAYQGPAREALAFFEQTGYPCRECHLYILRSIYFLSRTDLNVCMVMYVCINGAAYQGARVLGADGLPIP